MEFGVTEQHGAGDHCDGEKISSNRILKDVFVFFWCGSVCVRIG